MEKKPETLFGHPVVPMSEQDEATLSRLASEIHPVDEPFTPDEFLLLIERFKAASRR